MTDLELKNKIITGDTSAIKWLYQEYYVGLCTYANRFLKSKDASEEIVQQTLFKLWEKRESLQINESFIGYLFKSVRNHCLNHLKHQQIVNRYNESLLQSFKETEEILLVSQENGLSIFIASELEEKITMAIENLPEQCKIIFKLSRYEGLKHQEIAEKQGVTLNTVQKQISIALGKLKNELNEYLPVILFGMVLVSI
jgi:RNA polymerase sigma-70 factor (ECF subfamily)